MCITGPSSTVLVVPLQFTACVHELSRCYGKGFHLTLRYAPRRAEAQNKTSEVRLQVVRTPHNKQKGRRPRPPLSSRRSYNKAGARRRQKEKGIVDGMPIMSCHRTAPSLLAGPG